MKYEDLTKENKDLLIKDLCERFPYGVFCKCSLYAKVLIKKLSITDLHSFLKDDKVKGYNVEPILRPLSSMTDEDRDKLEEISNGWLYVNEDGELFPIGQFSDTDQIEFIYNGFDWLNKKGFDYRCLIDKGIALDGTNLFNLIDEKRIDPDIQNIIDEHWFEML